MRRLVLFSLLAAACGGTSKPPPPLDSTSLPSGAQLKPFSSSDPSVSAPSAMALSGGKAYLALTNIDANYTPAGPGLLVALVPSTGVQSII
ncbi:MAG TPA: hypothetical protein VF993_07580, partial [Myxococcales bacterium]